MHKASDIFCEYNLEGEFVAWYTRDQLKDKFSQSQISAILYSVREPSKRTSQGSRWVRAPFPYNGDEDFIELKKSLGKLKRVKRRSSTVISTYSKIAGYDVNYKLAIALDVNKPFIVNGEEVARHVILQASIPTSSTITARGYLWIRIPIGSEAPTYITKEEYDHRETGISLYK